MLYVPLPARLGLKTACVGCCFTHFPQTNILYYRKVDTLYTEILHQKYGGASIGLAEAMIISPPYTFAQQAAKTDQGKVGLSKTYPFTRDVKEVRLYNILTYKHIFM